MTTFSEVANLSGLKRVRGVPGYLKHQIFQNVDLRGLRILDIGGGNGLISFWCVLESGAQISFVVDPLIEGSHKQMSDQFKSMLVASKLDFGVEQIIGLVDDVPLEALPVDIIVMHNTVNHIDESATRRLHFDRSAWDGFVDFFNHLNGVLKIDGKLIIADCARRNLFGDLGIKNPLAPTIDWKVHQQPSLWRELVEDCGFEMRRLNWTSRREFGSLGRLLVANTIGAYCTTSHFVMEFSKR